MDYGWNELFAASQEFCGGLVACLFLVAFWLAVKILHGFMAISAKIWFANCLLWLGGLTVITE